MTGGLSSESLLGVDGRVVVIGAGGIAAPAALALGQAGVSELRLSDDDRVEASNLHRQILFDEADVGRLKTQVFAAAMAARFPAMDLQVVEGRALPHTVLELLSGARVVIDATDNFASRFLLADAAHLAGVPVVHAASVRWQATVMTVSAGGRPCYRCVFEDIPTGPQIDCATAGVMGPVCGVSGAVAADRAIRVLRGDGTACGRIVTYDGLRDRLRELRVSARRGCPLCGAAATIRTIDPGRYIAPGCGVG